MTPSASFPYLAKATVKYKSPHKQDLTFAKGETIRVTGVAPKADDPDGDDDDDDDDWLVGESLDGSRQGTFPGGFVEPSDEQDIQEVQAAAGVSNLAPATASAQPVAATESSEHADAAPVVPEAAREAAQEGKTETAGFGAPLPPRPAGSDDEAEEDDEDVADPAPASAEPTKESQPQAAQAPSAPSTADAPTVKDEPAVATAPPARQSSTSSNGAASITSPAPTTATSPPATTKSPPPIATKPSGMSSAFRDRLAAFNKPAEAAAPPPVPRGKPGGWKRPTPAPDAPKPVLPGQAPATAAPVTSKVEPQASAAPAAAAAATVEPVRSKDDSGFSAADAQSSIKMSLKERMAALQRGEGGQDASSPPPAKPAPAPGRIGAEKRNAALAGMGLAPAPPHPARSLSRDSAKSGDDLTAEADAGEGEVGSVAVKDAEDAPMAITSADAADAPTTEASKADEDAQAEAEETSELTEEEQEAQRRAALAKRMAALGGRRMGGGPALFGAPAAAPAKKPSASSASEQDEGTSVEPGIVDRPSVASPPPVAAEDATSSVAASGDAEAAAAEPAATSTEAEAEPKTLAVPRRAAPPRRKRPVPSAAAAAAGTMSPSAEAPPESESAVVAEAAPETTPEPTPAPDAAADHEEPAKADDFETSHVAAATMGAALGGAGLAAAASHTDEHDAPVTEYTGGQTELPASAASSIDEPEATTDAEDGLSTSAATPSGYESEDARIKEHERQLEEYLRGREDSGDAEIEQMASAIEHQESGEADAEIAEQRDFVPTETAAATGLARQSSTSLRQDASTPKPPSRPPSTRPPVPKTSLPPPPVDTSSGDAAGDASLKSPLSPGREAAASPAPSLGAQRHSFVPPVPRSSVPPPPARAEGVASPPPLPRSPPPMTPAPTQPSLGSVAAAEGAYNEPTATQPDVTEQAPTPILAAPRPRMAVPTEDPEDEALLQAADAAQKEPDGAQTATADAEAVEEQQAEEAEPVELTEEEQEAQRRANLANRMARLGGQRIGGLPGMAPPPIMGAPMPPRRKVVPTADEEEQAAQAGATDVAALETSVEEQRGHSAQASEDFGARDEARDAPVRLASPPPIPKSPPPKSLSPAPGRPLPTPGDERDSSSPPPLPIGRPSSTAPLGSLDEAAASIARSSTPGSTAGGDGLARRTSLRPMVPQGLQSPPVRSREASQIESHPAEVGEDVEDDAGPEPVPRTMATSPPTLPSSPPPRPSSRAPPLPGAAGVAIPSRDASHHSTSAAPPMSPTAATAVSEPTQQPLSPPPTAGVHAATPSQGSTLSTKQSTRDLDLMPSSRWWRHGLNPLRLPPTVAGRPDAILYADTTSGTKRGKPTHSADVYVLFEDYSTTTISLSFQEDDAEESATTLSQSHNFPPPKPGPEMLQAWSAEVGASIARSAAETAKHPPATPIGDGTSRSFAHALITSNPSSLPPVGAQYGAVVLTQVGGTVMEQGGDEVRPGDVAVCTAAELKGKRGLAPYHATYGSAAEPMVAIVVECESKKNKLRCVTQRPRGGPKGGVEEVSLRLDDLRSGVVKVFRVAKRGEWVDW